MEVDKQEKNNYKKKQIGVLRRKAQKKRRKWKQKEKRENV